ncbi:MAG: hypothetical protein KC477_16045 [Oceanospirillaceae bacterium]|nr:hypothetical protein [Oceanospirillaceae bacterium]
MKLSKPILLVLTLLLCWGQLSYAVGPGPMIEPGSATMQHMECEDACSAMFEACDDMQCSVEHGCSGSGVVFLPADGFLFLPAVAAVSLRSIKTYAYHRSVPIEHPPRVIAQT